MNKCIISEGKTTNEAIENGLKEMNVSKNMVDVKVLKEEKKSFFSILAPRVVKVQLTLKDSNETNESVRKIRKEVNLSEQEQKKAKENVDKFLKDFFNKVAENTNYSIKTDVTGLKINIENKDLGFLIGYRGETLYSLQNILSAIAGKDIENRVRIILDIEGYKEKREKALEDLADKLAKTVIKTRKTVTLEPMQAYERKIIHSRLQDNEFVETKSIGEEPRRKVVISLKKK